MDDEAARFATVWSTLGLSRLGSEPALMATLTAASQAAVGASRCSSVEVPPLPALSLGAADAADETGGEYARVSTLGEGGMGVVYLARQRSLRRDVAVKMLRDPSAPGDAEDLLREALITGGLEHPNIVPVHALGRDAAGHPMLVMKRIEGAPWRALLSDPQHPGWEPLLAAHGEPLLANLEVLSRVAEAAQYAHRRGVVHRDIKPDNVMIGRFGEVYLVDWGVALRLDAVRPDEAAAAIRGTPAYMAPEMVEGDPRRVDPRTDVYLLGATLHELLTGRPRHDQPGLHATLFAAYLSKPAAYGADVAAELAALCNDATAADPAQRPQSALAFRRRLTLHLQHRASLTLTEAAQGRARALAALRSAAEIDDLALRAVATEARFGYAQALVIWPDNAAAAEGLEAVRALLVAHELSRENLDAARSLAAEMSNPGPALSAALDALSERLTLRKRNADLALTEAREGDLSVAAAPRARLMLAMLAVTTAAHLALALRGPAAVTLRRMTAQHGLALVLALTVIFVWRRALVVNRVTRQFMGVLASMLVLTFVHRLFVLASAVATPVSSVVLSDLMIAAGVTVMGAFSVRRWFAVMTAACLVGAALVLIDPARATRWFTLAVNAMLLVGVGFSLRPASRDEG